MAQCEGSGPRPADQDQVAVSAAGRLVTTAGERVALVCPYGWVSALIDDSFTEEWGQTSDPPSTLSVRIEGRTDPFDVEGWILLARGAWARDGDLVMHNVCSSGFDLLLRPAADPCDFTFRWRPSLRSRAASMAFRSRFRLLVRAVLIQYPAMWWAGVHGRAPLHAPVCTSGSITALLAGPGGVGKSTLTMRELEAGNSAVSDNLSVSDGTTAWGVVEPMRSDRGTGRRMPHGRREAPLVGRVSALTPNHLVILRQAVGDAATVRRCDASEAARALITGTYMAGELRRFWGFAATLAAGTGLGPAHPPVAPVAKAFAARLPCMEVCLPKAGETCLGELLNTPEAIWA
jgi:hypothetical protein